MEPILHLVDLLTVTVDDHTPAGVGFFVYFVDLKSHRIPEHGGSELQTGQSSNDNGLVVDAIIQGKHVGIVGDGDSETADLLASDQIPTLIFVDCFQTCSRVDRCHHFINRLGLKFDQCRWSYRRHLN